MSRTGGAVQESRTRSRRIGALYAVLAALALMVALPATAWAAGPAGAVAVSDAPSAAPAAAGGDSMTSFDDKIVLDKDGGATFTETIAYSFGPGTHHGIFRNVVVRQQATADNTDTYRYYSISDVAVTSPTGAPTGVQLIDQGSTTQIRIGDANTTVDGPQTYVVRYHLANIMNPFTDHAELFYNIFLDDLVPKDVVTLSVSGPGGVTEAACYRGDTGSTESCGTAQPGNPATFQATNIQPGENLTIATKLPRAGFGALAPDLRSGTSSVDASQAKALTALTLGGGILVPVVAAGLMATLVATRGRDEWYAGLTPGLTPGSVPGRVPGIPGGPDGALASAPTVRGRTPTIAVQFTPPPGVQPGMVGTIVDESVDTVDVSATVIDLAVRGYLRIEETKTGGMFSRTDWSLTRLNPDPNQPPLRPYESTILEGIFATANPIQLSDLKFKFNTVLASAKSEMYDEVVQRGWFRKSPQSQRGAWQALGFLLIGGGIASLFFLTAPTHDIDRTGGWGIGIPSGVVLGLGLIVGGLIFRILGKRMAAKTAEGSAMNAQALGFKKYLVTAEAGQIKFEEAQSIFSRYLPYAIVFGVADHWASTFQQVAEAAAASGQSLAMPSWYLYNGALFPNFTGIADGVGSFATSAGGTFAASASSGGSGGSGFGGGGFSGGGGGGSSSGSW